MSEKNAETSGKNPKSAKISTKKWPLKKVVDSSKKLDFSWGPRLVFLALETEYKNKERLRIFKNHS